MFCDEFFQTLSLWKRKQCGKPTVNVDEPENQKNPATENGKPGQAADLLQAKAAKPQHRQGEVDPLI